MSINKWMASEIKCYLKLYHASGLYSPQSHPPMNYQILDENTLLRKTSKCSKQNYQLYTFNKIFSSRISNSLIAQSICFIDDLYEVNRYNIQLLCEGINHTMITMLNHQTQQSFTTGTVQQYGMLIQMYLALYNDKRIKYRSNSVITLSVFATVNEKPNQFIDLLNGQRYRFLSRRDVDTQSYKVFYQVRVGQMKEYLVAMKIAMIRFKQCCDKSDFLVWRIKLSNCDQLSQHRTMATGNIVVCQQGSKNTDTLIRQLANLVQKSPQQQQQLSLSSPTSLLNNHHNINNNNISSNNRNNNNYSIIVNNNNISSNNSNIHSSHGKSNKVTDHGSLFSCLEGYLRNGKVSVMVCLINDYDDIEGHLQLIDWVRTQLMGKITQYRINPHPAQLNQFITQSQIDTKASTQSILKRLTHYLSFLSMKQVQKFKQLQSSFKLFIRDSIDKLTSFFKLFRYCLQVRQEFFERERFPVGIEIKTFNDIHLMVKRFFIAKIYSLSEKYQMQNLESTCEKMMTIRNQLEISLKTLTAMFVNSSKKHYSTDLLSKNYVFVGTSRKNHRESLLLDEQQNDEDFDNNNNSQTIKYEKVLRLMRTHLQRVRKYLKYILNINPRYWQQSEHIIHSQSQSFDHNHQNQLKFHHLHHHFIVLIESVNFGNLLGQELFIQVQKQLKNLGYKKQLSVDVEIVSPKKERNDNCQGGDNSNRAVRNQVKRKTILLNQRSQRSQIPTNRLNLLQFDHILSPLDSIQALKIHQTLHQKQQSLQNFLKKIKQVQIQKHFKIRQRISEYQQSKMKQQINVEEIIDVDSNKQKYRKVWELPKKSLRKLKRMERQMGAFSNYEVYDGARKGEKYIKTQTVNVPTSSKHQDKNKQSIVGKVNHNRQETNSTSIHVDDPITGVMKKYNSEGKLKHKRRESQSAMFPDISKSVEHRVSAINSVKSNGGVMSSQQLPKAQSLPKLKKKQMSKVVRSSLHQDDYATAQERNSKVFLPDISLICRKIAV